MLFEKIKKDWKSKRKIDVSHHMAEEQALATLEVLKELNAEEKPIIIGFNLITLKNYQKKSILSLLS